MQGQQEAPPPQGGPPPDAAGPEQQGSPVDWGKTSFPQLLEIVHGGLMRMAAVVQKVPGVADQVKQKGQGLLEAFKGFADELMSGGQADAGAPAPVEPGGAPQPPQGVVAPKRGPVAMEAGVKGIPKV